MSETTYCYHCGIPIVGSPDRKVWCAMCASRSGGWCQECKRDVAEHTACWQMEQALKTAQIRGGFASNKCLACSMELVMRELGTEGGTWHCKWVCPKCKSELTVTWRASRGRNIQPPPPGIDMAF